MLKRYLQLSYGFGGKVIRLNDDGTYTVLGRKARTIYAIFVMLSTIGWHTYWQDRIAKAYKRGLLRGHTEGFSEGMEEGIRIGQRHPIDGVTLTVEDQTE